MERRPPPLPVPFRPVGTGLRPMERSERRVREGKVSEKPSERGHEERGDSRTIPVPPLSLHSRPSRHFSPLYRSETPKAVNVRNDREAPAAPVSDGYGR